MTKVAAIVAGGAKECMRYLKDEIRSSKQLKNFFMVLTLMTGFAAGYLLY